MMRGRGGTNDSQVPSMATGWLVVLLTAIGTMGEVWQEGDEMRSYAWGPSSSRNICQALC